MKQRPKMLVVPWLCLCAMYSVLGVIRIVQGESPLAFMFGVCAGLLFCLGVNNYHYNRRGP